MLSFHLEIGEVMIYKLTPEYLLTLTESGAVAINTAKSVSFGLFANKIVPNRIKIAITAPREVFQIKREKCTVKKSDELVLTLKLREGIVCELIPEALLALTSNSETIMNDAGFTCMEAFVAKIGTDYYELAISAPKDLFRVTRSGFILWKDKK
jgi:sRNA-binding carbon storage regulator CsrA